MLLIPTFAPGWFPPTGFDGTNGRALWLELMGLVQGGVGSTFLVSRFGVPVLRRAAAFRPQTQREGALVPSGATQGNVA